MEPRFLPMANRWILYFRREGQWTGSLVICVDGSRQPTDGHFSKPVKLKISSVADDFAPFLARRSKKKKRCTSPAIALAKTGWVV